MMDKLKMINLLINRIESDQNIKSFKYYSDFISRWKTTLQKAAEHDVRLYKTMFAYDQVYIYNCQICGFDFVFNFNIPYILKEYETTPKKFCKIALENHNGKLYSNGIFCCYTKYASLKKYYHTPSHKNESLFLVLIPLTPLTFTVVDGNHRISQLIDSGKNQIQVLLVGPYDTIKSLESPFQRCIYGVLFDYMKLSDEIETKPDEKLRDFLVIFNDFNNELLFK